MIIVIFAVLAIITVVSVFLFFNKKKGTPSGSTPSGSTPAPPSKYFDPWNGRPLKPIWYVIRITL